MKKILLIAVFVMSLMVSSCGFTQHSTSQSIGTQTKVELTKANFRVIGLVEGESTQTYVLGIGGLSPKSMKESALTEMYKNANLTGSQAIINTNVFFRKESYILWMNAKAIATGTIIEFIEE